MICSKLTRITHGTSEVQEEIVTGMSDYIPSALKNQQNINILIIGDHKLVVNQIFWNQFFAKTLVKEAYYFLMHNYLSEGRQTASAVFAKLHGKIYKIEEVMDWKSGLRDVMAKETSQVVCLEIQGFQNKGSTKKINLFVSRYATNIDNVHLTLRTNSIEVAKISKNDFQSQLGTEYRNLEETDRVNKPSVHSASQYAYHSHKTKQSLISNLSLRTKQSKISKENEKPTPSKIAKKNNKKVSKEKTQETAKKSTTINKDFSSKSYQNTSLLKCQRPSISRETVLSKIITSKQYEILTLKQELQEKTDEYTILIRDQQEAHEKQIQALTKKVKEVLQSYSQSQKEAANENVYLKERVRILQETIEKTNNKMETYNIQMQGYVKNVRDLEEMNKRLTETNRQLSQEQEKSRSLYLSQYTRMNSQITSWRDKAEEYKQKYEKIVDTMKGVIGYS